MGHVDVHRPRLVVIDDLPENRLLVALLLSDRWSVVGHESGTDALNHLGDDAPDAVLLDLSLNGERGEDVLLELRRRLPGTVPVMAFTASEGLPDTLAHRFDGVVSKPIMDGADLGLVIEGCVTRTEGRHAQVD